MMLYSGDHFTEKNVKNYFYFYLLFLYPRLHIVPLNCMTMVKKRHTKYKAYIFFLNAYFTAGMLIPVGWLFHVFFFITAETFMIMV